MQISLYFLEGIDVCVNGITWPWHTECSWCILVKGYGFVACTSRIKVMEPLRSQQIVLKQWKLTPVFVPAPISCPLIAPICQVQSLNNNRKGHTAHEYKKAISWRKKLLVSILQSVDIKRKNKYHSGEVFVWFWARSKWRWGCFGGHILRVKGPAYHDGNQSDMEDWPRAKLENCGNDTK